MEALVVIGVIVLILAVVGVVVGAAIHAIGEAMEVIVILIEKLSPYVAAAGILLILILLVIF